MQIITEQNRKWWILAAVSMVMFMLNLDLTIVNLALPAIARELNASLSQLQWLVTGYVVTCAMFTVLGGKLGDIYGHKLIFLLGTIIFTLASLMAGFSHMEWMLLLSRIIQGVGAALAFPLINVITFAIFPEHQKGAALGMMATTIGLAQAAGPSLGGIILKLLNWHWMFFINLPIGLTTILLTLFVCPKYILPTQKIKIDYMGVILLASSLFFILLALNESQNWGLFSELFSICLGAGIIFLVTFIVIELRMTNPLIDLRVFTNKLFSIINFIRPVSTYSMWVILFVLVLYLQNIVQYTPLFTGILLLSMTIAFGILSPLCGRLMDGIGIRIPILLSTLLVTLVFLVLTKLGILPIYLLVMMLFLIGLGSAILVTGTNIIALSVVPKEQIGAASGAFYTNVSVGAMLGIAVSGTIIALRSSNYLTQQLMLHNIHVAKTKMSLLISIANGSHSINKLAVNFTPAMTQKLTPIIQQSFLHGFASVMLVCAGLAFISFLLMLWHDIA